MKVVSDVFAALAVVAMVLSLFVGLPVVSEFPIDPGSWAFIAAVWAMAAWARASANE